MKLYIVLNSDRVHISSEGVPVETHLFSRYLYADQRDLDVARQIAIGLVVSKAIEINGGKVSVIQA